MSASVLSADALRALRPLEVASYLRVHGWRQEADLNGKGSVWLLPAEDGREETDITLPLQRDLGDFALRMGDVLRTLRQSRATPRAGDPAGSDDHEQRPDPGPGAQP